MRLAKKSEAKKSQNRHKHLPSAAQGTVDAPQFGVTVRRRCLHAFFVHMSTQGYRAPKALCNASIGATLGEMSHSWDKIAANAVEVRHALHRNPELTWQEHQTAQLIRSRLDALHIPWRACAELGTVAHLEAKARGPHIALRSDMDALPISEKSGVPWSSQNEGVMHACGHDGHTATLLAAAQWLKERQELLPGPVSLLFQPAEEGGHGAKKMVEDGALDGVDFIFGYHNWPALPFGQALCPDGPVMCANGAFTITLRGIGGHASQPELCRDPVLAAAATTLNLQQIVSRRVVPQEPAVVSVTQILAPSGATTIPNQAELGGSIRASSTAQRTEMERWITQIAEDTARAYGVEARVALHPRYGATVNHASAAEIYRSALLAELGPSWQSRAHVPIMASEDFSYYLETIPGAFALIGAGKADDAVPCHNACYDFDDRLVGVVGRVFARLAGISVETPSSPPA